MIIQKTWTELLGHPQGNEMVWGNEIVRKTGQFSFIRLWTFDNHTQATNNFYSWLKESGYVSNN